MVARRVYDKSPRNPGHNSVRTDATKVGHSDTARIEMKCSIQGCSGDYVSKRINQSFNRDSHLVVIDGIPALVCDICGDVIFSAETTKAVEVLLESTIKPSEHVQLYRFG